jgi:hypothetical protein
MCCAAAAASRGIQARVHYWYQPDSYDAWIPLHMVDNKEVCEAVLMQQLCCPVAASYKSMDSFFFAEPQKVRDAAASDHTV